MSTKLCLFGVPPHTEDHEILQRCAQLFAARPPRVAYVGLQEPLGVRARRWFYLLVDREWGWAFEPLARQLAGGFPDLTALLQVDAHGRCRLEHYATGEPPRLVFGISSEGPHVELHAGTLAGMYPQMHFSRDELEALQTKPEAAMTESERHAVFRPLDAVRIGLAELFPDDGDAFLAVGRGGTVFALVEDGRAVEPQAVDRATLPPALSSLPAGIAD